MLTSTSRTRSTALQLVDWMVYARGLKATAPATNERVNGRARQVDQCIGRVLIRVQLTRNCVTCVITLLTEVSNGLCPPDELQLQDAAWNSACLLLICFCHCHPQQPGRFWRNDCTGSMLTGIFLGRRNRRKVVFVLLLESLLMSESVKTADQQVLCVGTQMHIDTRYGVTWMVSS
jgi:hypothetical protein